MTNDRADSTSDTERINAALSQYERERETLTTFASKLRLLVEELLQDRKLQYHSVSARVKKRNSLERKLKRDEKYQQLSDVTDVVGLRVITYFPDDVDHVADLIAAEFEVDHANSVDKRKLDPDRFGYLSLHYVAALASERGELSEYRRFRQIQFEIQMRSILQHAWAEIEHDLGYHSEEEIPRDLRRRFSRLAGLLEIADDEFASLRDELQTYGASVAQGGHPPEVVFIDRDSMMALLRGSATIREVDRELVDALNATFLDNESEIEDQSRIISIRLQAAGLKRISEVEPTLLSLRHEVVKFAERMIQSRRAERGASGRPGLPIGITLFHLAYVLVGSGGSRTEVVRFLEEITNKAGDDDDEVQKFADEILVFLAELREE